MRSLIPFPLPPALARLFALLEAYTEGHEQGFFMAEQDRNRQAQGQPVLIYIRPESLRPERTTPERRPPDWIGEVVEAGADDAAAERQARYARAGVPEVWRVEPQVPRVLVLTEPLRAEGRFARVSAFEGTQAVASPTFPGLTLTPADLAG